MGRKPSFLIAWLAIFFVVGLFAWFMIITTVIAMIFSGAS